MPISSFFLFFLVFRGFIRGIRVFLFFLGECVLGPLGGFWTGFCPVLFVFLCADGRMVRPCLLVLCSADGRMVRARFLHVLKEASAV